MNSWTFTLASGFVGFVSGIVSVQSFFPHSWVALIIWSVVGLGVGAAISDASRALWGGGAYGAFLTASFLIFGFQGAFEQIPSFFAMTLLLSLFGAGCGAALGFIGNLVRR